MKKRLLCFFMAMVLVFSMAGAAFALEADGADMAQGESASHPSTGLNVDELGPSSSLQLTFAALQLELAQTARDQAMDRMDKIAQIQQEQKQVSEFLNAARQARNDAQSAGEATPIPPDMAEYMEKNGLAHTTGGDGLSMTADEWDTAISSLQNRMDTLGLNTQQEMIYVQNFMNQYNSYTQGANLQAPYSSQTISSLSRGQSMYGDSEVGLAVTALVIGLVLGCLITLAVQRIRIKKNKA